MANFHYTGRTNDGKMVDGNIEANSRTEVVNSLRRQQIFPVKIEKENERRRDISFAFSKKKVTVKDISIFCRQFYTIVLAGISAYRVY